MTAPKIFSFNGTTKRWSQPVVPNNVHYVWFSQWGKSGANIKNIFRFHHFMSVLSAYKYIKPKTIYFWCDHPPEGRWWMEARRAAPTMTVMNMSAPKSIYGQRISIYEHMTDVARMDIVMKHGGIYTDLDVVALKSWDPLLYYDTTMSTSRYHFRKSLTNSVIISAKNSSFLRAWKDSYHDFHKSWGHNSLEMPYEIAKKRPELIHIVSNLIEYPIYPYHKFIHNIGVKLDWSKSYGMHLFHRAYKKEHDPDTIKTLNSTLGEIFRIIYYNTIELMLK